MLRRPVPSALLVTVLALAPACSSTGTHSLECNSVQVSPGNQPGAETAKAALDWFLKNGRSGLPRSGFELETQTGTRAIYAKDDDKVSVTTLPTSDDHPDKVWVVSMTYSCS